MRQQNNLAYDFELFSEKKSNVIDINEVRARQEKINEQRRSNEKVVWSVAAFVRNFVLVSFVIGVLCMGIYTRGEITEIKSEIEQTKTQIEALKSEETRLNMQIEAALSVKNIEAEAQMMGMQKQEKAQTSYLVLDSVDEAQVIGAQEQTLLEKLKVLLSGN